MIKKITYFIFILFTSVISAQSISIGDSNLFSTTNNATWTHVITATTTSDGVAVSSAAQTLVINITSLPDGSTYRVYKTTASGGNSFSNGIDLTIGENILTVAAVTFNRAVKFQFSGGGVIEFDSLSLNGTVLYGETFSCESGNEQIGVSGLFNTTTNSNWPFVFIAVTTADGAAVSSLSQTLVINITNLPDGASYRVYKTTANGSGSFGSSVALTMGENTLNVAAVTFNRAVKFQFSSGDICFDSLTLNSQNVLGLEDFNSDSFSIYPNPASGIISINGVENINSIKVYSILGALEKEFLNTNQIDISELSSGIHLIKIDNGTIFSKKIIKQ